MRRAFKTLLLWLLLLALPIQGIAAAAMTSCHLNQQATTASVTPAAAHPGNHALHDGHHDHHHATSAVGGDGHAHHDSAHPHHKHDASTSCSACAACCLGAAALPAGLNWAFLHNSSEPVLASPSPFMTAFIPAGIERPPRLVSA